RGACTARTDTGHHARTVQTNANGTVTTYAYTARHMPTSINTVHGATTIQTLGFTRDAEGHITTITSPFPNESWSPITYDALDRLIAATNTTTSANSQTFTYDAANNLTSNSLLGTYAHPAQGPSSMHPHAVTNAGGTMPFTYDENGSRLTKGSSTYGWDGENRLISVDATQFTYDANDNRVKKTGTTTSYYVTPHYKVVDGVATKTIMLGK